MAKKPSKEVVALVNKIAAHSGTFYISQSDGLPLLNNDPPLIEVNTNDVVDGNAACRLTEAGQKLVTAPKAAKVDAGDAKASPYAIITTAVLPPSKRGGKGGGAPTQYPFDDLAVGQTFFVPVSEKHPDPVKTLGSTVSSANLRYAVETGEKRTVNRAKRGEGNKAVMVDGKKVMETKEVPVYKYERKFSIRAVVKGQTYGTWVADADGALIGRVE